MGKIQEAWNQGRAEMKNGEFLLHRQQPTRWRYCAFGRTRSNVPGAAEIRSESHSSAIRQLEPCDCWKKKLELILEQDDGPAYSMTFMQNNIPVLVGNFYSLDLPRSDFRTNIDSGTSPRTRKSNNMFNVRIAFKQQQ